jgi:phage gpG-like protein
MAKNKKHKRRFEHMRRSIILWIQDEFENIDVKIMSHVFTMVLLICIVAATVAWFTMSGTTKIKNLNLSAAEITDIEISLTKDGENIGSVISDNSNQNVESNADFEVSMPGFSNVYDSSGAVVTNENSDIMAPGTYGSFTFWVRSVNENFTGCNVYINQIFTTDIVKESSEYVELQNLLTGHILCFKTREGEIENYTYSNYISNGDYILVDFDPDKDGTLEPQQVTIYWVWPYEYADITTINEGNMFALPDQMENIKELSQTSGEAVATGKKFAMNQVFEWRKYNTIRNGNIDEYLSANKEKKSEYLTEWYDYADTLIGQNVKTFAFHIIAKGVRVND